jgi:hypothetical protein
MARPLIAHRATTLRTTVWRAIASFPPTEADFYSYADLGRELPTVDYLRLTSVSMYLSLEFLDVARERYGLPPDSAELDLRRDRRIRYALTNEATGHIEVWGPPDVLLACVVGPGDQSRSDRS